MIAMIAEAKDDSYPTRSSLIRRVKDTEDRQSWQEFYAIYSKLILRFAIKAGLNEDEAREVVQETLIAAAKHLPEFRYTPKVCSFKTWLLNLSNWRVQDQFRKRQALHAQVATTREASTDDTRRTATVERVADPAGEKLQAIWDKEWRTTLLDAALARVKPRVDAKQWQIFDLCALKEWSVAEVTKALGVGAGRVYLAKHRIASAIAKEIKCLEKAMERTAADTLKSEVTPRCQGHR
jgi:RNA polymerase sigma-70 factor (ECF subfamily)